MWTELLTLAIAYVQTPQGMAMIVATVAAIGQFFQAKGINVPAIGPLITWLHSITGGSLLPVPGTLPVLPPLPTPGPIVNTGHPLLDFLRSLLASATSATIPQTLIAVKATVANYESAGNLPPAK